MNIQYCINIEYEYCIDIGIEYRINILERVECSGKYLEAVRGGCEYASAVIHFPPTSCVHVT